MVALLIAHGALPNQKFEGSTPFRSLVWKIVQYEIPHGLVEYTPEVKKELSNYLEIIETMLQHSADASACFLHEGEYKTARRLLTERLNECWPSEAPRADAIFAKYGGRQQLSFYQRWISTDWSAPPECEVEAAESTGVNARSHAQSTVQLTLQRLLQIPANSS